MLNLSSNHPLRPTDWRWELAKSLKSLSPYMRKKMANNDAFIEKARKFQVAIAECADSDDIVSKYILSQQFPDQFVAYEIFHGASWDKNSNKLMNAHGGNRLKSLVEAYLLSGEKLEEIARHTCVDVPTLVLYEKWFFNVLDRISSYGWVVDQVIGPAIYSGISARNIDTVWKLYAYFGGPKILEGAVTTFDGGHASAKAQQWSEFVEDDMRANLSAKAALAARSVEINERTVRTVLEMYSRFRESEKELAAQGAKDHDAKNMQLFMQGLGFSVGLDESSVDYKLIERYDSSCAEPRADELLAITAGCKDPVDLKILDVKFPEPIKNDNASVK